MAFLLDFLVGGWSHFLWVLQGQAVEGRTIKVETIVGQNQRLGHRRSRPSRVAGRAIILHCGAEALKVEPSWVRTIVGAALMRREAALVRGKKIDQTMKNLLTQWEMRRKTVIENFL